MGTIEKMMDIVSSLNEELNDKGIHDHSFMLLTNEYQTGILFDDILLWDSENGTYSTYYNDVDDFEEKLKFEFNRYIDEMQDCKFDMDMKVEEKGNHKMSARGMEIQSYCDKIIDSILFDSPQEATDKIQNYLDENLDFDAIIEGGVDNGGVYHALISFEDEHGRKRAVVLNINSNKDED